MMAVAEGTSMPGWAFSVLIGVFVSLILASLLFECIGERGAAGPDVWLIGLDAGMMPRRRPDGAGWFSQ
jgi:hypothetical protein